MLLGIVVLCVTLLLLSERWRSAWLLYRVPPPKPVPALAPVDDVELPMDLRHYVENRWAEPWAQEQQRTVFTEIYKSAREAGHDSKAAWDQVRKHGMET